MMAMPCQVRQGWPAVAGDDFLRLCVCVCACVCIHIYIYIYIRTHIEREMYLDTLICVYVDVHDTV